LMRRTFVTAERLAMAMEARCYREDPTPIESEFSAKDWVALGTVAMLCAAMIVA
jgi:energy-coupling factor transporter transmembrane protein EcfT